MMLKGEMTMLNILRLQETDIATIRAGLEKKRDEAPQFFMQSPVIVDCSDLADAGVPDFYELNDTLISLGFVPVGIRGLADEQKAQARKAGWALLRDGFAKSGQGQAQSAVTNAEEAQQNEQVEPVAEPSAADQKPAETSDPGTQDSAGVAQQMRSVTIQRPVRSGQQVYAANADMTVLAQTSAGSELVADGSIHVYGPLRGRVLAGARGNEEARIFCNSLQAELIAIAGRYQLLDESNTDLKGKPAMIRLEGERLIIEPLGQ